MLAAPCDILCGIVGKQMLILMYSEVIELSFLFFSFNLVTERDTTESKL